jgi:ribosomal protein S18 acetylase RimI-like enzyme
VIVLAFVADPLARFLWRDPEQYLTNFPAFMKALGTSSIADGNVHYVEGYLGAALWLPPDVHLDMDPLGAILQRTAAPGAQEDMFATLEQMGRYHPSEPHWYLPTIGIDPTQQGKGYGSALLSHALIACDRDRKLAYLEASNTKNIPLYQRYGFELLGTIKVGTAPSVFPMLRKPRQ